MAMSSPVETAHRQFLCRLDAGRRPRQLPPASARSRAAGAGRRQLALEPLLFGDARLGEAGEQAEDDRRQEQRDEGREAEAADDDPAERAAGLGAGAAR